MATRAKKAMFICSICENVLKVMTCSRRGSKLELLDLEAAHILSDTDEKGLSEKIIQLFKKLGYEHNPVIVSLPRSQATCRYLKVPTHSPEEIERIASLQASRYLPYPVEELITAFQIISTGKDGYSHINLTIVHKDTVERYFKPFRELKVPRVSVVLSSYGICELYNAVNPNKYQTSLLIDIDSSAAELAIVSLRKLVFSRSFKLSKSNWQDSLVEEINKTQDVYLKEISGSMPSKINVVGAGRVIREFPQVLNNLIPLPIEVLSYEESLIIPKNLSYTFPNSEHSFASLIGLGLGDIEASLNILPKDLKEKARNISLRNIQVRTVSLVLVWVLIFASAIFKDLDNKKMYLKRMKKELNRLAEEARPLEDIENRFKLLGARSIKKPTSLDILYELNQITPDSVSLSNLLYEEDKQVILRGQTQELNSVFTFVGGLEKSGVFKGFNVKVRYASGRKTQSGEIIDFEIDCLKK